MQAFYFSNTDMKLSHDKAHASERLIDALHQASGPVLHRVGQSGAFDATDVLREFAAADVSVLITTDVDAVEAARSAANEMLTAMVREATGWDI